MKSNRKLFELIVGDDDVIDEIRALNIEEANEYFKYSWGSNYPATAVVKQVSNMNYEVEVKND